MDTAKRATRRSDSFPEAEVRHRLRPELLRIASQASVLRPPWEPLLDSKRVVAAILVLEDLFPGKKIPPDRVVKKGGYEDVDEAIADIVNRIRGLLDTQGRAGDDI